MMTKTGNKYSPSLRNSISIMFLILAVIIEGVFVLFWFLILSPRLEKDMASDVNALSQSNALILAGALSEKPLSRSKIEQTIDELMLLKESVTKTPFITGVELIIDYDVIQADEGSLDILKWQKSLQHLEKSEFISVEVPLFDRASKELLGIATFYSSRLFFEELKNDVMNSFFLATLAIMGMLFVCWSLLIALLSPLNQLSNSLKKRTADDVSSLPHLKGWVSREILLVRNALDDLFIKINDHTQGLTELNVILKTQHELSMDGILVLNRENNIITVNKRFSDMWGLPEDFKDTRSPEENRLIMLDKLVDPQATLSMLNYYQQHPKEQSHGLLTFKDGRTFEQYSSPMIGEDQAYFGRVWFFHDISEHKRNIQLLKEREEFLTAIIENIPHLIVIKDAKHLRVVRINKACEEMLGISREEMTGKSEYDFMPKEDADMLTGPDRKALETGEPQDIPCERVQIRTKGELILHTKKIPIMDADGRPSYLLMISEDITHRLEAEKMEKDLKDQLRQAQKLESLGTLAGGIAHDFNNILSAIIGFSELVRDYLDKGSAADEGIQEVIKASGRATELVRQILTFSRQAELEFVEVNIKDIVKEALKLLRSSLPSSIEIRETLDDGMVKADATQIHQVVMNLCTNAYHAMLENGGVLTVNLTPVDVDEHLALSHTDLNPGPAMKLVVSDTGHGIPESKLENIFDPYFTTKEQGKGTGLGLSVVHGIVKNLAGAIIVESSPGQGTVFSIYFPRIAQVPAEESLISATTLPTGSERILFVDDEPILADLGDMLLGKLGYKVTSLGDSMEALERFRLDPHSFDLLITDMTMPKMTGDKLASAIRAIRPDIPVIICSGYNDVMGREEALATGFSEYIFKPLRYEILATIVRKVLDRT